MKIYLGLTLLVLLGMSVVNKPVVSKTIALAYKVVAILIAALTVFFVYAAFFTPMGVFIGVSASAMIAVVGIIILLILASLHRTRYILTKDKLVVRTTKLIGGSKIIPLKTVKSGEKTMIPFGIRLFGASFTISQVWDEPF